MCCSTDPADLLTCTQDIDCAVCDDLDDSDLGYSMTCQAVADGANLSTITKDGTGVKSIENVSAGMYCLPKLKECDYSTGSALWTDMGWICDCNKYGSIFGGSDCTEMQACNNDLVTDWSKDKQSLLLNIDAVLTDDKIGDQWDVDQGINPLECHDSNGNIGVCNSNENPTQ